MSENSSKMVSEKEVLICKHLLGGAKLHWVHHLPKENINWNLMCEAEHQFSDMRQITLGEAIESYQEISEFLDIPSDLDVSFKRGKNSGKWYDFHRDK